MTSEFMVCTFPKNLQNIWPLEIVWFHMITSLGILSVGQLWFALTKTVPLNSHTCQLNIDLHFLWSHVLSCLQLHTQTGNNVTYVFLCLCRTLWTEQLSYWMHLPADLVLLIILNKTWIVHNLKHLNIESYLALILHLAATLTAFPTLLWCRSITVKILDPCLAV